MGREVAVQKLPAPPKRAAEPAVRENLQTWEHARHNFSRNGGGHSEAPGAPKTPSEAGCARKPADAGACSRIATICRAVGVAFIPKRPAKPAARENPRRTEDVLLEYYNVLFCATERQLPCQPLAPESTAALNTYSMWR